MSTSSNRGALHALNGQLLKHLAKTLSNCRWGEWIVNVIILHRTVGIVETATLETSATLWHGDEYFSEEDCDPQKRRKPRNNQTFGVRSLNGAVPLDDSFAGWCVQTGNVVWVSDLKGLLSSKVNPLRKFYHSFAYVDVTTDELPDAEYVFPIRLRAGLSDITWGVLNCEWYSPDGFIERSPFEAEGRDRVESRVIDLLELHGRYLPIVMYEDGLTEDCEQRLFMCYERMFELHELRMKGSDNEDQ